MPDARVPLADPPRKKATAAGVADSIPNVIRIDRSGLFPLQSAREIAVGINSAVIKLTMLNGLQGFMPRAPAGRQLFIL